MFSPFACCASSCDGRSSMRTRQERKMRLLRFWRDGLERQLAALDASITTLQRQMDRDAGDAAG